MIKTLWFMVKVAFFVAVALWVAEHPGFVEITWLDYEVGLDIGLFLIAGILIILISIFIYRVIDTVVGFPASFRRYQEIKNREKGYRALTLGLTAVAAGDTKSAVYQAHRAEKLLGDENSGLTLLLRAQAARLDGREEDAQKSFVALLENEDAAFLGVRGLLQTALDTQNHEEALDLARRALQLHPKQPWILKTVYDLEIRARDWDEAVKTLARAEKAGAMNKEKAGSDRVAVLLAKTEELLAQDNRKDAVKKAEQAYRLAPNFVPAAVQLARLYNQTGKRRKAINVVEKAWKREPHPELADLWDMLGTTSRAKKKPSRMQWFEKLLKLNTETAEAQFAAGQVALEEGLWGEARTHFTKAEQLNPSAKVYKALALLEERSTHNEEAAIGWLEKAGEASPGKAWLCRETGHIYERWHPVAQPHGSFNTIEWSDPSEGIDVGMLAYRQNKSGGLLEAS